MQNSPCSGDHRAYSGVRVRVEKKAPAFFAAAMKLLELLAALLDVLCTIKQLLAP